MKKLKQRSANGVQRINRRRFVRQVAVGTVMAFGIGLATQSMADDTTYSGPYGSGFWNYLWDGLYGTYDDP